MKRGELGRQRRCRARSWRLSSGRRRSSTMAKPRLGMNGKGMRRIDRHGRQDREDLVEEEAVEPRAAPRRVTLAGIDDGDAVRRAARRAAGASSACWLRISSPVSALMAASCWAGVRPSWLGVSIAAGLLALQAGHAHHVEFVEVVGRDRQEAHPLEQRMVDVVGLLEHPLVEGEPGELAVDEAGFRRVGKTNGRTSPLRGGGID